MNDSKLHIFLQHSLPYKVVSKLEIHLYSGRVELDANINTNAVLRAPVASSITVNDILYVESLISASSEHWQLGKASRSHQDVKLINAVL